MLRCLTTSFGIHTQYLSTMISKLHLKIPAVNNNTNRHAQNSGIHTSNTTSKNQNSPHPVCTILWCNAHRRAGHRTRVVLVFTVRLRTHTHGLAINVCPSVCQTRGLWQHETIVCRYFNTIRHSNASRTSALLIGMHLRDIHPLVDYDASESQSMLSIWSK